MSWVIGILTFVLVVDCLFLILLILIQLPKKEAGLGQAFGGSTTDALFGAGSGTVLTKMTKYAAGFFFGLTFLVSILGAAQARQRGVDPRTLLKAEKEAAATAAAQGQPAAAAPGQPAAKPAATSVLSGLLSAPAATTNTAAPTNAAPKPAGSK